ncbi:MAG: hypothetical protein NUK65_00740 [Firmicutes bacterium]|nr:hypothetical protein [Bacillota bacterium]
MRQIRFKVKHLLSVCAILLVFFALGYLLLPSLLFSQGEKYRAQGEPLTAKIYYDRLNDYFPQHGKTAAALEQAAIIASEGNLLMVTPRSIGGTGGHPDAIISQEAVDYYTLLVERFPDTWHGKSKSLPIACKTASVENPAMAFLLC